jgi:hypothetical protein
MRLYHIELTDSGFLKDHLNNLILNNLSSATTLKKRLNPEDEQPFGFHPKDLTSKRVKLTEDKALRIYQDHNTLTFSHEDLASLSKLHLEYNPLTTSLIDSLRSSTIDESD